jgi:ankyrin repeat protein
VRVLVGRGADVDACDQAGHSPLVEAASQGNDEAVSALLDLGATVQPAQPFGVLALAGAATPGILRRLLAHPGVQ